MTMVTDPPTAAPAQAPATTRPRRRVRTGSSLLSRGEPMIWLSGGALWICVLMIVVLLAYIGMQGFQAFWPEPLERFTMLDGTTYLGEVSRQDTYQPGPQVLEMVTDPKLRAAEQARLDADGGRATRTLVRTGNFELSGEHYRWLSGFEIAQTDRPEWALLIERQSWGRFYGFPASFTIDGEAQATDPKAVWALYERYHDEVRDRWKQVRGLETDQMGAVSARLERARTNMVAAERIDGKDSDAWRAARDDYQRIEADTAAQIDAISKKIQALRAENARYAMTLTTAGGKTKALPLAEVVRAFPPNQLGLGGKLGVYGSRWWEFLSAEPREANSEGGVWPAIFGTVLMTMLMSVAVVPFGVLAALYLREYAKQGPIVSAVRIAINNLAGVPSIVFGVFGLAFFCYGVGKFIDGGPANVNVQPLAPGAWFLGIGVLVIVAAAAVAFGLLRGRRVGTQTRRQRAMGIVSTLLWLAAVGTLVYLVVTTPYFHGFYTGKLPNPTFGKGAILWASLTLALLTLPVVIVATEEALSAVPGSMREGSYACGGSKWQTIWRIVLPRAMPGIMTGMILAMARGAGEVAPLMLVGAVKMAPTLPISSTPPFGADRSFLHLGFHIFDLGFQSQNSEAAKPMIFTTTLLLIAIIAVLNITAIWLRGRLRKKFVSAQF